MATIGDDRIEGLNCACAKSDDAPFRIEKDGIVCVWCGKKIFCTPPVAFVTYRVCACSPDRRTTHIIDAAEVSICTRCSRRT